MSGQTVCVLCDSSQEDVIIATSQWRVIMVSEPDYPGFCRVIWQAHVREMSDLSETDRQEMMRVVWQVEAAQRAVLKADKINLASLGNVVPHLHWHVIPRFTDDAHFPQPVWAPARPEGGNPETLAQRRALLPALRSAISSRLEVN